MKLLKIKKVVLNLLLGISILYSYQISYADEINDDASNTTVISSDNDIDSTNSSSETVTIPANSNDAIGNMLLQSVSLMGIAYKWGGNTPDTGMDCSGFVRYVFKKSLGINLPRTAAQMAKVGRRIEREDLEPGDLIFFNTNRGSNMHIGIYLGSNKFIQSPRTGENIQISELAGYWAKHFNGAKRVVQEDQDSDGQTTLENYDDIHDQALPVHFLHHISRHKIHSTKSNKRKVLSKKRSSSASHNKSGKVLKKNSHKHSNT